MKNAKILPIYSQILSRGASAGAGRNRLIGMVNLTMSGPIGEQCLLLFVK
jgi:hypothetical protein